MRGQESILFLETVIVIGRERVTDLVKSFVGYLVPSIWRGRKERGQRMIHDSPDAVSFYYFVNR